MKKGSLKKNMPFDFLTLYFFTPNLVKTDINKLRLSYSSDLSLVLVSLPIDNGMKS